MQTEGCKVSDDVVLATYKVTKGGQISVLKLRPHLGAGPGDKVRAVLRAGQVILEKVKSPELKASERYYCLDCGEFIDGNECPVESSHTVQVP